MGWICERWGVAGAASVYHELAQLLEETVALRILAIFALPVVLVALLFLLLGIFVWWPFYVLILPAAALVLWFLYNRADQSVLSKLGARNLGEREGDRFRNTVENLTLSSGIDHPNLFVIDSEAVNLAAIEGKEPALVATSGLLETLDVMELEGVVAHGLTKLSSGAVSYETLAASASPLITGWQRDKAREWGSGDAGVLAYDISGVGLTRYPPGLRSALERIDGRSTDIAGGEALGAAWLVPPAGQRVPLDHRIEVLWEL